MPVTWTVKRGAKTIGPLSVRRLKELASEGKIKPDDLVQRSDVDKWVKASSVKGLLAPTRETVVTSRESVPVTLARPPETRAKSPPVVIQSSVADDTVEPQEPEVPSVASPSSLHKQRLAVLVTAGVGAASTLFPWLSVPIAGVFYGITGWFGLMTLGACATAAVVAFVSGPRSKSLTWSGTGIVGGMGAVAFAGALWPVSRWLSLQSQQIDNPFAKGMIAATQLGPGVYIALLASVTMIALALTLKKAS